MSLKGRLRPVRGPATRMGTVGSEAGIRMRVSEFPKAVTRVGRARRTLQVFLQNSKLALRNASVHGTGCSPSDRRRGHACGVPVTATAQNVPDALRRYEALRLPRASRVEALSEINKMRFHLPDGPAQQTRDAEMARGTTDWSPKAVAWLYGYDAARPESGLMD